MKIQVKKSKISGKGVFAIEDILKGELIERCDLIILLENDRKLIDKTKLYDYYFAWGEDKCAIALGYGSLYNHSFKPNSVYTKGLKDISIEFRALEKIKAGDEILVNYNCDPNCLEKVWFEK